MKRPKVNILVPMAGSGRLFQEAGEAFPKPLVEVAGKPMIQVVCEDLACDIEQKFIFVVRKSDVQKFAMREVLRLLRPECEIIVTDGDTAGAACTALVASDLIDSNTPLVIANADQYIGGAFKPFLEEALSQKVDGSVIVFESIHPKWSFVRCDEDGYVIEAAEKRPISKQATVGIYYFREGRLFVDACKRMIKKGAQVMGQYFICPCLNEMILKGLKISAYRISRQSMWPFSSPADVAEFERAHHPEAESLRQ